MSSKHSLAQGYAASLGVRKCSKCGQQIEWFQFHHGKKSKIAFNLESNSHEELICHFDTCTGKKAVAQAPVTTPEPKNLERELCMLLDRTKSRVIIVVQDEGALWAFRNGIPAEDLRHDVITAVNRLRSELGKVEA